MSSDSGARPEAQAPAEATAQAEPVDASPPAQPQLDSVPAVDSITVEQASPAANDDAHEGEAVELAPLGASAAAPAEEEEEGNGHGDAPAAAAEEAPTSARLAPHPSSQGGGLPSLQDYLDYVKLLHAPSVWGDAPKVSIGFKDLSYLLPLPVDVVANPSVWKASYEMFQRKKMRTLDVYEDLTGVVRQGKMTLVLAPPGAGKSQFLKTLGGHMRNNKHVKGELLYDGLTPAQQLEAGLYTEKLCALVAQGDVHMANLTVRETLQFALDNSVLPLTPEAFAEAGKPAPQLDKRLLDLHSKKVDLMLSVLGMHECANTIAGNEMIRGISGGQKKRLTIGELLITNARCLLLDEPTTGLDAAVSRDIMLVLREWCQVSGGTVIAALLQATPECFALYDDIILMKEGRIVFQGPRTEVQQFMEQSWGFIAPDDMDLADYIVQVLTNPDQVMERQQRQLRQGKLQRKFPTLAEEAAKAAGGLATNGVSVNGAAANGVTSTASAGSVDVHVEGPNGDAVHDEPSASRVRFHISDDEPAHTHGVNGVNGTNGASASPPAPDSTKLLSPVNTQSMLQAYKDSVFYARQLEEYARIEREGQVVAQNLAALKAERSPYTLAQYGHLYTRGFGTHTKLALGRQFTLLARDKQTVPPRIFSAIFQSLIFGSLFFDLDTDNFYPKLGILLFSIMFFAMGNFTELPATFEGRNAVYKQVDAGMFPTLSYMFALTLASLPIILAESSVYCIILYFMIGLAEEAGRFFFFWLCMIVADLMFCTFFRAICYKVTAIDGAQQVAMPVMNVMMIYSGFMILKPEIKNWQIEFFWLSPFSWIIRSVSLNEFGSSDYDPPIDGIRKGDYFMKSFGMDVDSEYKWAGIGYVLGCVILATLFAARWLGNTRFDLLQGTKRLSKQATVEPVDEAQQGQMVADKRAGDMPPTNGVNGVDKSVVVQINGQAAGPGDYGAGNAKSLANMQSYSSAVAIKSVLPFHPATFVFRDINYTVTVKSTDSKKGPSTFQKQLLTNVSGFVKPGQLCALMGSSGAGKTTLMDVIAGRKTEGIIEGDVLVDGKPKGDNERMFRRISGYCEQVDMHMPLATVRESLLFSAALRLPKSVSEEDRAAYVEEVLEILELTPVADRIVGNEKYAGLSPGQLKLLTIGVELAANPSILFLDEPTSGLDSRAALVVMRVVKKIALTGRSVLCTIHQPSSDVFFLFDSMLLLRSGGHTVYFGEIGREGRNLVDYFQGVPNEKGIYPKIPQDMNPASWMLDVIGAGLSGAMRRATAAHKAKLVTGKAQKEPFDYATVYRKSELGQQQTKELEEVVAQSALHARQLNPDDYAIPLARQVRYVLGRGMLSYWRDEQMNFGRILMLIVISLIFGIVYVQLDDTSYTGLTSKTSSVFSIVGFIAMLSAQTTLPNIFDERAVYYREQAAKAYPSWIYSTTTGLCELPWVFFSSLLGVIIFYFMVGFQNDAELFFQFWLSLSLLVLIESSFGQFAAALLPNFVVAIQVAGTINTLFFLFGGLFIRPANIPEGWKWFFYMNPVPKSIMAILLPQFECHLPNPYSVDSGCPTITDPENAQLTTIHAYVQGQWDASYDDVFGRMMGWLVLTYAVFRVGIFLSLKYINHLKR